MDFNNLVLQVLNESPDGIDFEGEYYGYDQEEGNPQTVIIDQLLVVPDIQNPWTTSAKEEINSFPFPLGPVLVCGGLENYQKTTPDAESLSHTDFFNLLASLEYTYKELIEFGFKFYSPKANLTQYFSQIEKKHPRFTVYTKYDIETADSINLGRFWKIGDKVVLSMWDTDEDKKVINQFVLPFIKQTQNVSDEQIFIENPTLEGDFVTATKSMGGTEEKVVEPYQKEIAELLRQLHLASGDDKKRNQIKSQIAEIAKKHNLDPKKYGISDEVLKSSDYYAQRVLGQSKEPMASLKSKMMTSEKLEQNK